MPDTLIADSSATMPEKIVSGYGQAVTRSHFWWVTYGLLFIVIVFFAAIRFRFKDVPLERDEGEYAYAGQLILQGIPPYQLAYNMKFPGIYATYALILGTLGQTPAAIHLGLLLANAAAVLLVFLLARRFFGELAGIVAAASYALLSTSPSVLGFAAHATHFAVLPALGGILLLQKFLETGRTGLLFWSGTLLGLAIVIYQPAIFLSAFAGFYLISQEWKARRDWRTLGRRIGLFSMAGMIPFLISCAILWKAGVLGKFWFWTLSYGWQYVSNVGPLAGSIYLWRQAPAVIGPAVWIWLIAGAGLTVVAWSRPAREHANFLTGFAVFSFLAVCPGFYFREHYFVLMLPAVAVAAGAGVSCAIEKLQEGIRMKAWGYVPALVIAAALAMSLAQQRAFLFAADPAHAYREMYGDNPFSEAVVIADYIKSHSSPDAQIAVLGSEPEIYFYSGRHSASGYIYMYPLMEKQKFAFRMQQEMISEIEAAHPEFVVYVNVGISWLQRPYSQTLLFSWSRDYLQRGYEVEGVADIQGQTEYRWGPEAAAHHPVSRFTVYVFKRKAV